MASDRARERQKLMRSMLRAMALQVDPEHARLTVLAHELDVQIHTVLRWIAVGRTTTMRARALNRRFGDKLAPVSELTEGRAQ
jgi:hypothetical protein